MRIAIDARLNAYRQGGIPQYTRQLLTALAEVARDDQLISLQHRDQLRPLAVAPNVVRRTLLTPPHHRFEQWSLPLELLLVQPDVLHCPDFIAPVRRPCPAVVTIHDLAFMHYPDILDDAARTYYGQIKTNATRADGIIAVSEATRQDIAQFLDIPIDEIAVIHEAAAPLYGRLDLREGEARVLNATPVAAGTFMLFVSTLEPRKNLPTLLQALRICLDRQPHRNYLLVVVGARGWRDEVIFDTVRDLRLADHVLFAGSVGQYDLRWLYNACRFYINPSLYEGFGLPLLEAMACGAACLAAATSSLPEIGGDAAIYIPPLDAGLWADAIAELWDDDDRQQELGRLGRIQSQHFSWVRAARETLKIYERAISQAQRGRGASALPAPAQPRQLTAVDPTTAELPGTFTPIIPASHAIPGVSGDTRACLRCGTPMLASPFQRTIAFQPANDASDLRPLAPHIWACPQCGHIELVVGQAEAVRAALDAEAQPDAENAPLALTTAEEQPEPAEAEREHDAEAPEAIAINAALDSDPAKTAESIPMIEVGRDSANPPAAANDDSDALELAALDDSAHDLGQGVSSNGVSEQADLPPNTETLAAPSDEPGDAAKPAAAPSERAAQSEPSAAADVAPPTPQAPQRQSRAKRKRA
jgi:glycosyltransferase involved in cell wall biosynthesis